MKTLHHYKQGIPTILPSSDLHSPTLPPPSLRRTLSADMSSTKCFSSIRKVASSQAFSLPNHNHDHKIHESRKHRDPDSWSSILLHNSVSDPPKSTISVPYVHPLLKKTSHSLSEMSLQICTESLGSETGSDAFSSSEDGDFDELMAKTEYPHIHTSEWKPVKFGRIKSPPRSFPPPISSLNSPDGASVCIQSRRENGRLILDAVSVPSRKNFRAERRDGRLVLSFLTTPANLLVQEEEDELEELIAREFEEVKESEIVGERDDENDLEAEELEVPMEKVPRLPSSLMNFHRLPLMVKKPDRFINRNPAWPKEKNASETPTLLSQSLPPRPPSLTAATAAGSLNAYEYYWRPKSTGKSAGIQNPIGPQQTQPIHSVTRKLISSNNQMADEKHQFSILRGNRGDYMVPLSNGCKVPRRSVLLREPCCIATT
ncbi:protein FAF-like, chloroplastic [Benincasa hispida]|uniref:protein FAF-like, chloroplastic n=1 Tax=Benincasa hispida TaxID=102211 RepID=UPI001900F742|nr:protein FAF-like, chloroplastic [Benincasa hispida]